MNQLFTLALVAGFLSGCVANQGYSGSNTYSDNRLSSYKSAGTGYGFTLGTSEHAKCVQAQSMAAQKKTDCMLSSASSAIKPYTVRTPEQ